VPRILVTRHPVTRVPVTGAGAPGPPAAAGRRERRAAGRDGRGGRALRAFRSFARLTRGDRIALAVLIGVPVVVFTVPVLVGYPLLTGDEVIQNYPLRAFAGEVLRHGHLPLYDPFDWSGSPLLGGINAGAAYPAIVFFAALPPLAAWVATDVLAYAGAAVGLYAFLRLGRCRPLAAGLGGAAFGLAGFVSSQAVHIDVVETCASLAWLLVGLERCAHAPRRSLPGWIALAALATACVGLAGSPEVAFYAAVGAAIYAGHLVRHAGEQRWRVAGAGAGAAVVGVLLAGIQVLPGARDIASSQRAAVGHGFLTAGSLDGSQLLTLLAPHLLGGGPVGLRSYVGSYNLGEIDGYAGILALVAAAALATRWRAPGAWRWRVWYLVGGVGLLVALGKATPVPALLAHLPVIGLSRLPSRALVLYALASSVLLAHWAEDVLGAASERGRSATGWGRAAAVAGALPPLAVVALLLVVAAGGAPVARTLAGGPIGGWSVAAVAPYIVAAGLIAIAAGVFAVVAPRLDRRCRARALLAIALFDMALFTVDQSSLAPVYLRALAQPSALSRSLGKLTGPDGRFVVVDPSRSGGIMLDELGAPDLGALSRRASAQGYGSLVWAPYDHATGTHGQDVASPAAVAGRTFDSLDVTVLLVTPSSFEVPIGRSGSSMRGGTVRLAGDARVTRYFGGSERVSAVRIAAATPGTASPGQLERAAAALRLVSGDGAQLGATPDPLSRGAGGSVIALFRVPVAAAGLVLGGRGTGGIAGVDVTVDLAGGRRFSPTGPLSNAATAPHWRLAGTLGPYAVLRDTRASGRYAIERSGGAPVAVSEVSRTPWVATETIAVRAGSPFTLVRSVADIPGWSATLVRAGQSEQLALRRDGVVQSVALPAGHYDVTFRYEPPGLLAGLAASTAGAVALLLLVAVALARRRRDAA
jgi:hypothetical protein